MTRSHAAVRPLITDAEIDRRLRAAAIDFINAGKYPTSETILAVCDFAERNPRARHRLTQILLSLDMPESFRLERDRRNRAARKAVGTRTRAKRDVTIRGITEEDILEARLRVLADYRVYFGRSLIQGEVAEILDLFDAAYARKGRRP